MTDDQIIDLARRLGWNVEHAETNKMLILFARDIEDQTRMFMQMSVNNKKTLKAYEAELRIEGTGNS